MDYKSSFRIFARYGATKVFYYTGLNTRTVGQLGFYPKLEHYGYSLRYTLQILFKRNDKADVDSRMT